MMTNETILKVLELTDKNNKNYDLDKARQILKEQILKADNKESYKIISLVKKIIEQKELIKTRPALAKVQIRNNKQFICDGYVAVEWKHYEKALDTLPQNTENTIAIEQIYFTGVPYEMTANDITIINNIKAVKDYIKAEKSADDKIKTRIVALFGKFFDLNIIENAIKIMLSYNEDFTITKQDDNHYTPIQIENSKIKALILPVRILRGEEGQRIYDQTQRICDIIRG